ncbi:MAG: carbamate kinase [Alphaproteobacteria bacterium]|nr:carbamate kinase [Alphaproteobacteria bacterium]
MLVVAALGGNALLRRGEPPEVKRQTANIRKAARALAEIAREHALVVTHGNGPQVGLLALQSGDPLEVLTAETEGMIGYMIETALRNELPGRAVAGLLTQIAVDPDDPAFAAPTKPIGPVYGEAEAKRLAGERGWTIAPDGDGFRHVVPSPRPLRILEIETIKLLVRNGVLVICAGGGGVPVIAGETGWRGVEAVIDKDHASALLARELGADALLMLTDVDAVYADWEGARAQPFGAVTTDDLRKYEFAPGSMGPKVQAAVDFAEATGRMAGIGGLKDAAAMLRGEAGTRIANSPG